MDHSFNTQAAQLYGVNESILLQNLYFWICKNRANKKHFYDGRYWTYNSHEAFSKLFPYWSVKQIERIIGKLYEKGLIIKGNYNANSYDRTTWYSLTEMAESIYEKEEIHLPKSGNGNSEIGEPIPDSKQDNKKNNTPKPPEGASQNIPEVSESSENIDFAKLLEFINKKTGKKFKVINESVRRKFKARLREGYTKQDILMAISNAVQDEWHKESDYKWLTPEYFSRSASIEKHSTKSEIKTSKPITNNEGFAGPWAV